METFLENSNCNSHFSHVIYPLYLKYHDLKMDLAQLVLTFVDKVFCPIFSGFVVTLISPYKKEPAVYWDYYLYYSLWRHKNTLHLHYLDTFRGGCEWKRSMGISNTFLSMLYNPYFPLQEGTRGFI